MAFMEQLRAFLRRLGPGFITASVVLGPGSIVASSRAGAESGYRLVWMLAVAALFMAAYASMGARLGCALPETPLRYVAQRAGRWLAAPVGLAAFLVTAGFQFGNNIGLAFGMSGLFDVPAWIWPPLFTALSLWFLFRAKHLYQAMERLMMALVAVMILSFFANLFWTGIHPLKLAQGMIPRIAPEDSLIARAMLATTFSAVAAFYQAYLVRAKGWDQTRIRDAILDAWAGIAVLALICAAIMIGAAQTLHGTGKTFTQAGEIANLLGELLGPAANLVFCCGLAAASFSSFIVNAMIGGCLLADGLGMDARFDARTAKGLSAVVMVVGCLVAMLVLALGQGGAQSLLIAQAATLVAAPLCAIMLLVMSSSRRIMGPLANAPLITIIGAAGLLAVFWINGAWIISRLGW